MPTSTHFPPIYGHQKGTPFDDHEVHGAMAVVFPMEISPGETPVSTMDAMGKDR